MVTTTITPDESGADNKSNFRARYNAAKDQRHWVNLTTVTDVAFDVEVTLADQMFDIAGATAIAGINLPPSDATSAGMRIFYNVNDVSFAVTLTRDGTDTINNAAASPTPAVNTSGTLTSLGNGDWSHTSSVGASLPPKAIANSDSPYSVTASDSLILADATAGAITANLPTAAGNSGREITVKKVDSSTNAVTIDGSGSETIDDGLTSAISTQYESVTIVSDGTEWWIK